MTPVGHMLTGATLGVLAVPSAWRPRAKLAIVCVFALLAIVPDYQLPHWGHDRYDISHSIFVNSVFILAFALPLLASRRVRRVNGGTRIVLAGGLAWLSHLLLDTFYNHGLGLAMFWPFSDARLAIPIPWFETLRARPPHFDMHSARVCLIELAAYGTIFSIALLARRVYTRCSKHGQHIVGIGMTIDRSNT